MAEVYYKDADFQLRKNQIGDIQTANNDSAISQSLTSLFRTSRGERRDNLKFGANLTELLFSPMDNITANDIVERIKTSVDIFEPRIRIDELHINMNKVKQTYEIEIIYTIVSTEIQETFNFILSKK